MNKVSAYFSESYKELVEKVTLAYLDPITAIYPNCTGGHTLLLHWWLGSLWILLPVQF